MSRDRPRFSISAGRYNGTLFLTSLLSLVIATEHYSLLPRFLFLSLRSFCHVLLLSFLVHFRLVLFLPCLALPCLALSRLVVSCLVSSCHCLSFLVLFRLALFVCVWGGGGERVLIEDNAKAKARSQSQSQRRRKRQRQRHRHRQRDNYMETDKETQTKRQLP